MKLNINFDTMIKNVKLGELNISIAMVFLNTKSLKLFKRIQMLMLQQNYQQNFDKQLKGWFLNTYIFPNQDNNKFILLQEKGVYLYEYMDNWEKLYETLLPEKGDFYKFGRH